WVPTKYLLLSAFAEPQICYLLDGILFLYGIILTALYCRIKVSCHFKGPQKGPIGIRQIGHCQCEIGCRQQRERDAKRNSIF
uniref:Uncharacterized protein n=1 Tax=Scophthalmus maximus TaxID=52904 RepID=A0A8D3ASE1_SCOMX